MLSQKTRYTIRAFQHLADHWGKGQVQLAAIADAQNSTPKFLTVLLSELSREGRIMSQSWPAGGPQLALSPTHLTRGNLVTLTRVSLALAPCRGRPAEHRADKA